MVARWASATNMLTNLDTISMAEMWWIKIWQFECWLPGYVVKVVTAKVRIFTTRARNADICINLWWC